MTLAQRVGEKNYFFCLPHDTGPINFFKDLDSLNILNKYLIFQ